jgi:branched-chain amino acid transport system ATP-binding protein
VLRIRNLHAGYGGLTVLKGLSLHVEPGEIVAIVGPNGAGKSTLLKVVAGLVPATSGEITLDGQSVPSGAAEAMVARGCALVPEGRQLFQTLSVAENLWLGAYLRLRRGRKREAEATLERVYGLFPVLRDRRGQLAGTLSGGEQQMVAIGRALMSAPRLLLMDEPSTGIAPLLVRAILDTVAALRSEGLTLLLVEQNAREALAVADRGYVIETGSLMLEGASRELLDNPDVQRAYLGKDYRRIDE